MEAIVTAFDKYAKRYNERFYDNWESRSTEEKSKLREMLRDVDMLLSKRAFIPDFRRYVLKKVMNNQKLRRQRRVLVNTIVMSIVNPKGVRIKDVIKRTKRKQSSTKESELPEAYTRRNYQRILNEYYQDAFFKSQAMNENLMDDRFVPYLSVFASTEPPVTPYSNLVDEQYSAIMNQNFSNKLVMNWMIFSATLGNIIPEVLEDIQSFREECKEAINLELRAIVQDLSRVRKKYQKEKLREREKISNFFFSEVSSFSPLLLEFYFHFASILAWKWLRSRRPKTRKLLLSRGFPLRFSSSDIIRARKLLLDLTVSEDRVNHMLAEALQEYAFVTKSFKRFKQCLKSSGLPELDCGIVFENVATIHRENKNYKLMRRCLKDALENYEKAGNQYRVCVALKNLGEAEWYLGFKRRALEFFGESEKRGKMLIDLNQRFGVLWNLAYSFRRIRNPKFERNFLTKCLKILPETETEKILEVEGRLQQLDLFF